MKQFIEQCKGAIDLNYVNPVDGNTVMHLAGKSYSYWPQLYTMLKELGGNTEIANFEGHIPAQLMEEAAKQKDSYDYGKS